jgi:hypothetical protein
MRVIGRLLALLTAGMFVSMVVGAIAARNAKARIVPVEDPEANEIALTGIFGPLAYRSRATAFRGGTVDCWYGGGTIDLRGATLDPAGATLRVRAIFGGASIVVPADWNVSLAVIGLGGAGDGRPAADRSPDKPRLEIRGFAIFGGFGVTSEIREEERELFETLAETAPEAAPVASAG